MVVLAGVLLLAVFCRCSGETSPNGGDGVSATSASGGGTTKATTQDAEAMRKEFLAIKRPLVVRYEYYTVPDYEGEGVHLPGLKACRIIVSDDLQRFINRHNTIDMLANVVLPLLDDQKFSPDAVVLFIKITYATVHAEEMQAIGYKSQEKPGKWGEEPRDTLLGEIRHAASFDISHAVTTRPATHPATNPSSQEKP
jgi:hypothetical protein